MGHAGSPSVSSQPLTQAGLHCNGPKGKYYPLVSEIRFEMDLNRSDWNEDKKLKKGMSQYVIQNLRNMEILKYVARDFSCYDWSLPTLPRRMKHFSINYQKVCLK